jgi:hypothetical protein
VREFDEVRKEEIKTSFRLYPELCATSMNALLRIVKGTEGGLDWNNDDTKRNLEQGDEVNIRFDIFGGAHSTQAMLELSIEKPDEHRYKVRSANVYKAETPDVIMLRIGTIQNRGVTQVDTFAGWFESCIKMAEASYLTQSKFRNTVLFNSMPIIPRNGKLWSSGRGRSNIQKIT